MRAWVLPLWLAGVSTGAAGAEALAPLAWDVAVEAGARRLTETDAQGRRLLVERGPLARVQARVSPRQTPPGAAWAAEFALAGANLDYEGVTQGPARTTLHTDSRHRDFDTAAWWQPWQTPAWGRVGLGLRWLQHRRTIASTAQAGGLVERADLLMAGLQWESTDLSAAGMAWHVEARAWLSARHRLHVDFLGVYDNASLAGGRRRELELRLHARSPDSPWRWSVGWGGTRQSASRAQALHRGGTAIGSVRQPRVAIDEWRLGVSRAF